MKKLTALIMLLALLAAALTGCADTQPPATQDDTAEPEVSTGPAAESGSEDEQDAENVQEPGIAVVDEMEITLFLPDDQAEGFEEAVEAVGASPQGIVDALIAHGVLPEGTTVNSFHMSDNGTDTTEGEIVSHTAGDQLHIDLDLSSEFLSAVTSTGTAGESMVMGSLVNTMLQAYNADTLSLTCDGAVIETGHNIYDEPMTFWSPEAG